MRDGIIESDLGGSPPLEIESIVELISSTPVEIRTETLFTQSGSQSLGLDLLDNFD